MFGTFPESSLHSQACVLLRAQEYTSGKRGAKFIGGMAHTYQNVPRTVTHPTSQHVREGRPVQHRRQLREHLVQRWDSKWEEGRGEFCTVDSACTVGRVSGRGLLEEEITSSLH